MKTPLLTHDLIKLDDILNAIEKLQEANVQDFTDEDKLYAAAFRFTIIGEAANQISATFKERHSNLPWREMSNMRNKIVHEYFGISKSLLGEVIEQELPKLRYDIQTIIESYLQHLEPPAS